MKAKWISLLFPMLLTTAMVIAGVAYQHKIRTTDSSYGRLQKTLKGIDPFLQKDSRIYVTERSGEEFFHAQLQIFLPFNYVTWQDTVNTAKDSLLTIQKAQAYTIDTARLLATHQMAWRSSEGGSGYVAHLWLKHR